MYEFLAQYGLFLAKTLTLVVAIVFTMGFIASAVARSKQQPGSFEITDVNEDLDETRDSFEQATLDKSERKKLAKTRKKEAKAKKKESDKDEERLYVIRFDGDISASENVELRECVSAIISCHKPGDKVLCILESGGGYVHEYGLAASQLQRFKDANIHLTVAVDRVAASGGYLMACVADEIIAAPFAIIGSIGVIGQLPNFHKLLTRNHIEYEQHHAGEYKRTLTTFGKNTDKARKKFIEDLEQTHVLFKNFIEQHRPQVNLDEVATGEYWHAIDSFQYKLVDKLMTSDDYLLEQHPHKRIFEVDYIVKQDLKERLAGGLGYISEKLSDVLTKLATKKQVIS